ncbi:hypothetical protein R1flu_016511 [Riccia fluitans]|uniref:Uncharacterized protein n=1 Tax=Riccia fluitans TaxID=41844 RepID=A0ABD1YMW8_9MARC
MDNQRDESGPGRGGGRAGAGRRQGEESHGGEAEATPGGSQQTDGHDNQRQDEENQVPENVRRQDGRLLLPPGVFPGAPEWRGTIAISERARIRKNAQDRLKKLLDISDKVPRTYADRKLFEQVTRLMTTPLADTSSPDLNYGHRLWPLPMSSVEDYIDSLMDQIWLHGCDWRKDELHAERCRTLVEEFQRTGLPQTIHADFLDEVESRPGSEGARNCSFRCPCWEATLGEGWFNHTDASLLQTIGPDWGVLNLHLLLHLLKRVRKHIKDNLQCCSRDVT